MQSTKWNSEIKELFKATVARYPSPPLADETKAAYLEDWKGLCAQVGYQRFEEGVKRARSYFDFFPKVSQIKKMVPEPHQDEAARKREWSELHRRREQGEKFYTLADVFKEFCNQVESGKIKGRDESGQRALGMWVENLRGSERRYAAKMLASQKKRGKSDFQSAHEALLEKKS